ncbi:24726_t:CDS:2 [Racocetra persica]|uniref:24726_t:CDS:1 n=1 Tax=Racocetra persica TaxID=160502 RepID=A0ACA9MCS1_9GLOM|nr:24726_t:CDS:2 [Racocetra persica]
MATNGNVVNITFDDPILSAKVVLDNNTSKIIILDELEAVLLNKNNYRKIRNKLARKSSIAIYKKNQSYNAIEKNQGNENQVLDPNFQQLNTSEIMIEESVAQSSSFDIDEDNAIKESNLLDDTGAQENEAQVLKSKVQESLQYDNSLSDEYSDLAEEAKEQRFDTLTSILMKSDSINNASNKIKKNKTKTNKMNKYTLTSYKRISSDLTNNSLPSISEILPPLIQNDIEKDSDRNDVQAISSIINSQKNLLSNNNQRKPETELKIHLRT